MSDEFEAKEKEAAALYVKGWNYQKGYFLGFGRNSKKAFACYLKSAEMGSQASMFKVGCFYRDGNGVNANKAEAVKWLSKAAEPGAQYAKGYPNAREELERLR